METNETMIRETYRLVQDNNRMLHAMRRSAFIGGIFRFIFWIILLIGPIWFYMTYVYPTTQTLLQQAQKAQGAATNAQNQLQGFENTLNKIKSSAMGFIPTSTSNH
jgi:hypothetical protein